MSNRGGTISDALRDLKGKPTWGLTRTHGSMFFLEIGNPKLRVGEKKQHGEWHFLFQMCHWRFENPDTVLVGSDDSPETIDDQFRKLELQLFEHAEIVSPSNDLRIVFSSGVRVMTFSTCSQASEGETQWQLYDPSDTVWISNTTGQIVARDANE
jgi:hypothetical protein